MGLFSKSKSSTDTGPSDTTTTQEPKKSLYARYTDAKMGRNNVVSDADLAKYTGKSRAEFDKWAETAPDVAGRRISGAVTGQGAGGVTQPMGWGYAPKKYEEEKDGKGKNGKEGKVVDDDDSVIA